MKPLVIPAVKIAHTENRDDAVHKIYRLLDEVTDPEIPVLTIADIGILRDVYLEDESPVVVITPTYSGCPAMDRIRSDICDLLSSHGYPNATVKMQLAPAWTTDWMTDTGKTKLRAYGIAPPSGSAAVSPLATLQMVVFCPQCESRDTRVISEFGSTSCKALYKCNSCLEPFDYFKPI